MLLQGAIFDLDGVIVNTARFHYLAWKELAAELGFAFTPEDGERIKGVSRMAALDIVLSVGNLTTMSEEEKAALAKKKNDRYVEFLGSLTKDDILPGVLPFIEGLKARNVKTAIGSASKNTMFILKKLELDGMFDAIIDGNATSKAKPDPEVFLLGAQRLGLAPEHCAVFEDAAAGVQAAISGGMIAFGVGDPAVLKEARYVIPDFKNYLTLLEHFI